MFASYGAGWIFNKSVYAGLTRMKNIPILRKLPPRKTRNVTAYKIMTHDPKSLPLVVSVQDAGELLRNFPEINGYPVVTQSSRVQGLITRDILIVVIKGKCWYNVIRGINDNFEETTAKR